MSRLDPAKQRRQSDTYRKIRGTPDEAREDYGHHYAVKPLRGCRDQWDGEPFPVTVSKLLSKPEPKESTDA